MSGEVTRPMVRWLGSKWRMAPWILSLFPPHELYVEPYGGSASVLLRKPRSAIEVLGDMDDELLTLYSVLRDPDQSARLRAMCELTLYSDAELEVAMRRLPPDADPVERARRMIVRHALQVSPDVRGETRGTAFRRYTAVIRRCAAADWASYPDAIPTMHRRLKKVVIERRPAVQTMRYHDRPEALHYVDPPYVHATRSEARKGYSHELADADHAKLLDCLLGLKGMVMLSGYACPLYDEALVGWRRLTREVTDHARQWREEVLWLSPSAVRAADTDLIVRPRHPTGRRMAVNEAQVALF